MILIKLTFNNEKRFWIHHWLVGDQLAIAEKLHVHWQFGWAVVVITIMGRLGVISATFSSLVYLPP